MIKRCIVICLIILLLGHSSYADVIDKVFRWQAAENNSAYTPIEQTLPALMLETTSGIKNISNLANNEKFIIAVRDPDCPISRRYALKLKQLKDKGIPIIYLLSGKLATQKIADKDQQRHQLDGLYLLDKNNKLSNWLGVQTSAEVYLFDKDKILKYRGAIDDQYGLGFSKASATQNFLLDAINALEENRAIPITSTSAPGCIIRQTAKVNSGQSATWYADIYPLMEQKCMSCHRPGQAGPFPLETYQQVQARKEMIRFVLANNIMPPWSATGDTSRFVNDDKYLLDKDREKLIRWIDAGAPEGDYKKTAPIRQQQVNDWKYGQPDIILTSPVDVYVPAQGEIEYKYVSIPTNFAEDRWVHTVEVATDTPENTHHIILFVLPPKSTYMDFVPGAVNDTEISRKELHKMALRGFFSGYIPGLPGVTYEDGLAKLLPKGWRIVMQIHHQANGKQAVDRPRVGLQFLDQAPTKAINTLAATNIKILIPAGKKHHEETAQYYFKSPGEIVGLYPHMHLRGSAFRYELLDKNGNKQTLLDIPAYDPNWQQYYQFREPIIVDKGSSLIATGWFDNSESNLNNPDHRVDVKFGLRTRDEMLIGYFDWVNSSIH